tara:strand:- start:166 stop:1041 length:876 start_codon:yes stop_codon:yes gene_type:complete
MNIRTLEYILAVYETGHFAKAAEKCNVSQPSLSIQIKKFEEQYGIKLFERDNKNFHTTRHGETLIQKISGIVSQFHDMEKTALRLANPDSGDLYIGAFPTLAPFYIPKVMPHIVKALPKFKFYLIEERSPRLIEQLQNGELDAALLALPIEEKHNFHVQTLFQEDLLAAVPANHTLAQRKNIALADLRGEALLLLEDSHCLSGQALEACEWAGLSHRHDFRATSIETLRQMVANGMGITLLPRMACDANRKDVAYIEITDKNAKRTIGLVSRKGSSQDRILDKMADILKNI